MLTRFVLLVACFCFSTLVQSQDRFPAAKAEAVDAAVRGEMERQQLVGVSVGIIQNGKIVYTKGYGLAEREKATPMTAETVVNWASNSKPLAAVLAMKLVQEKKLDLDADVRTYVPEFPAKGEKITCRHLLTHQSGIPHYTNGKIVPAVRKYNVPDPLADPVLALDRFNQSPLIFKPGERTSYSSYAFILLSAAIQKAGKKPFLEQVQANVATPLGMKSLQPDTAAAKPNWAQGYTKKGDKVQPATDEAHYWKHGGGAFKSNVSDFARWAQALINRELVNEATEQAMWQIQKLNDGTATTWGLGFTVEVEPRLKVSHNGKQPETTTRMVLYPKDKHGVVVMCNCDFADVGKISTAVYTAMR